ncbi:MAG: glycoside hydrolase family 28 protein [Cyclobacteriaceae bacterium]
MRPYYLLIASILLIACNPNKKAQSDTSMNDPWNQLDSLIAQIKTTNFPDKDFMVTDFGAAAGDDRSDYEAIQKAIEECSAAGGGRVVVPAGVYHVKSIYLKSNVNLHLMEGAELRFSTVPEDYLPVVYTRWEGVEMMGLKPLVYAFEEENIALTGKGTLNGQAGNDNWWPWCGAGYYGYKEGDPSQRDDDNRAALFQAGADDVPVSERIFGVDSYLRPQFFQPYKCERVLVQGVTFTNSPMWIMHPTLCNHVIIDGVSVISHGPNSDGCDPESSKNVWIKNCLFDTGDDCIAIKSGRNHDGRRVGVASENIIIQNCVMKDGHGGVVIGSEASGGVNKVFAENCQMDSPELDRALRIKTSTERGGVIEKVYMRNVQVGQVKEAVLKFNMFYGDQGGFMPTIRDVRVENVTVKNGGKYGILAKGYAESPISNIYVDGLAIETVEESYSLENVDGLVVKNFTIGGEKVIIE